MFSNLEHLPRAILRYALKYLDIWDENLMSDFHDYYWVWWCVIHCVCSKSVSFIYCSKFQWNGIFVCAVWSLLMQGDCLHFQEIVSCFWVDVKMKIWKEHRQCTVEWRIFLEFTIHCVWEERVLSLNIVLCSRINHTVNAKFARQKKQPQKWRWKIHLKD